MRRKPPTQSRQINILRLEKREPRTENRPLFLLAESTFSPWLNVKPEYQRDRKSKHKRKPPFLHQDVVTFQEKKTQSLSLSLVCPPRSTPSHGDNDYRFPSQLLDVAGKSRRLPQLGRHVGRVHVGRLVEVGPRVEAGELGSLVLGVPHRVGGRGDARGA